VWDIDLLLEEKLGVAPPQDVVGAVVVGEDIHSQ